MDVVADVFAQLQGWLFERLIQPLLFALGLTHFAEIGFDALETMMLGLVQIALLYLALRPLEARFPAEQWSDRSETRVDVIRVEGNRLVEAVERLLGPTLTQRQRMGPRSPH